MLAYGIYYDNFDRLLFHTLFESAKSGNLTKKARAFDPSVACQQIFSYLYQKRRTGTSINAIKRLLGEVMKNEDIEKVVATLIEKEVIEVGKGNLYFLTPKLGRLVQMGKIHSNIPDKRELEVIDARTNKKLGIIQNPLPRFTLGGRRWVVVSGDGNKLYVTPLAGKGIMGKVFSGKGIFWLDWWQGIGLKNVIFAELNTDTFPYFIDEGKTMVFHFAGPLYGMLWQKVLQEKGIEVEDVGDFLFVVNKELEPERLIFTEDEIIEEAFKIAFQLKYFLDFGTFFNFLPQDIKKEAIVASLELKEFTSYIRNSQFEPITTELGQKVIRSLT